MYTTRPWQASVRTQLRVIRMGAPVSDASNAAARPLGRPFVIIITTIISPASMLRQAFVETRLRSPQNTPTYPARADGCRHAPPISIGRGQAWIAKWKKLVSGCGLQIQPQIPVLADSAPIVPFPWLARRAICCTVLLCSDVKPLGVSSG